MKVFYMGLEPYIERYSYQLESWNVREFDRLGVDYHVVRGTILDDSKSIKTGSVLDAHGRTHYSLTQHAELVRLLQEGQIGPDDVIFYEDMFTPGIESLAYVFDQLPTHKVPSVYVRCLAQTIDPDDFVHRTGMFRWMFHYEHMVDELVRKTFGGILCASEEMVPNLKIRGFRSHIYVTGLPFGKQEVQSYVEPTEWSARDKVVVYAARWDDEKQPGFFRNVAQEVVKHDPSVKFKVLTGGSSLKSSNPMYVGTEFLESFPNLEIHTGLSKTEYYNHLANARVLFNCALQDWVSNTVSEADANGCMTVYPAYRSFPEVFANNPEHMYLPWSVEDAAAKILKHLHASTAPSSIGKVSSYQDKTIERTIEIFQGEFSTSRDGTDYRKYVATAKY